MTSIVLLGSFNPRIFQPAWFVAQGLLAPEEGTASTIQLINNDFCAFETDWCRVEVLGERCTFYSLAAPIVEALRDLALGTFRILRHTPIVKVGLNTHAHFAMPDRDVWNRFGHLLAPKDDLWSPILQKPGTLSLTIQGVRPDDYEGHINVKVEPSSRIEPGIFVETNEEFRLPNADSAEWVSEMIEAEWVKYRQRAEEIQGCCVVD